MKTLISSEYTVQKLLSKYSSLIQEMAAVPAKERKLLREFLVKINSLIDLIVLISE